MHSDREREAFKDILANIDLAQEFNTDLTFAGFV